MCNFDIQTFMNFKNHEESQNLNSDVIECILNYFTSNNKYKYKNQQKKIGNILKNPKLKIMKDKISNKINLILNKISENNIENLVIEFIENIRINNIEEYNDFLKIFYNKILSEINFLKFYLKFFIIIGEVYLSVYDFSLEYFYKLIENKFNFDYYNILDEEYDFLRELNDESRRLNNLTIIQEMYKLNFFKENFLKVIEELLLKQSNHIGDLYFWFKNNELTNDNKIKIKGLIDDNIQLRNKILLENLINNDTPKLEIISSNIINKKNQDNNTNIELENMFEEYLFIDNYESLEEYIHINCKDALGKNKFCEFIILKYFNLDKEDSNKIFFLLKALVKKKILFKSNLSRGLLNICNKGNTAKIKSLLIFLKSMGITNGLENLMNKYNIEINI